jgi:putative two-component system response regulator
MPRAAAARSAAERPSNTPAVPTIAESAPIRLLVVDDDEAIRVAITRFLRSRGYDVTAVGSAADALAALERDRIELALCDVRMPGMTGLELLAAALERDPTLAILMLTAVNDAPTATEAFGLGASDYLVKPVELVDLQRAVERALHRRTLLKEQRRVEQLVREEVAARTAELEREKSALRDLTVDVAETLINAMEAKDVYLRGHSQRVAELAASIAAALTLDDNTVESIRLAGRLHDVGKIGIRESVLNKPEALTPEEFDHVKDHVRIGMEILAPLRHLGPVLDYIHDHHERYDGSGYPRGLAGQAITLGGRIVAAADAYEALTSQRAYRESVSPGDTIGRLEHSAGSHLDPTVVRALRVCVLRRKSLTFIE